ncbi:MAG: dipeptidase [Myxococcota bacterium]
MRSAGAVRRVRPGPYDRRRAERVAALLPRRERCHVSPVFVRVIVAVLLVLVACEGEPGDAESALAPHAGAEAQGADEAEEGDEGEEGDEAEPDAAGAPTAAAEPDDEGEPWIAIDTHVDTPARMVDGPDDIGERVPGGHLDLPRMREGGLTGAFFSIYVSPGRFRGRAAWERTLALIASVKRLAETHPDAAALCTTAAEVRAAAREGKAALLMGVEGAHGLGEALGRFAGDESITPPDEDEVLARVRQLHEAGVRYMTITWSIDNPLGHSSSGVAPEKGLTPLGRRVVRLMNELGMIVDVSHVSDRTFWDIMDVTRRPVLASHSSARALADHPRNMRDPMIRAVAEGGGAVCVNYYTQFIDHRYARRRMALDWHRRAAFRALDEEHADESWVDRGQARYELAQELAPDLDPPGLDQLVRHFAHITELGGPGAACLGSDFDGVPELPLGIQDVSELGNLTEALREAELPVRAIAGENVLRVLAAQEGPLPPE